MANTIPMDNKPILHRFNRSYISGIIDDNIQPGQLVSMGNGQSISVDYGIHSINSSIVGVVIEHSEHVSLVNINFVYQTGLIEKRPTHPLITLILRRLNVLRVPIDNQLDILL